jgi:hypothetical protein
MKGRGMKVLISTTTFAQFDDVPFKRLKQAGFEPILNLYSRKLKEFICNILKGRHFASC